MPSYMALCYRKTSEEVAWAWYRGFTIRCPACEGKGEWFWQGSYAPDDPSDWVICGLCHGWGLLRRDGKPFEQPEEDLENVIPF